MSAVNHKPATPLPWHTEDPGSKVDGCSYTNGADGKTVDHHGDIFQTREANEQNGAYKVHAANAYPKLVEALKTEAATLRAWAAQSRSGGWSTHQVEPQLKRAHEIELMLYSIGEGA